MKHTKSHKKPASLSRLRRMLVSTRDKYAELSELRLMQYRNATGKNEPSYPLDQDLGYQKHHGLWNDHVEYYKLRSRMSEFVNVLDGTLLRMSQNLDTIVKELIKPPVEIPVVDLDRTASL